MDKNTKTIVGIIIVALVVVGAYLYKQKANGPDNTSETATTTDKMTIDGGAGARQRAPVGDIESLDQQLMNLEIPSDTDLSDSSVGL